MRKQKKEKETESAKKSEKRTGQEEKVEKAAELEKIKPADEEVIGTVEKKEEYKKTRKEIAREKERETTLASWVPKTQLGRDVKTGKIKDIDQIFKENIRILEPEIVDMLLPNIETELINIGQAKGKFGGGKRRPWRQTQKKSAEGNVPTFGCMAVIGDRQGRMGLGYGKAKETVPAKQKAFRNAKLNIIAVERGCGSFECVCKEPHSIPFVVEGKSGSSRIKLMPAPKGTGLVIDDECKKILRFAGIKDIYSKTFGQTKTKFNLAKATINALKKLSMTV